MFLRADGFPTEPLFGRFPHGRSLTTTLEPFLFPPPSSFLFFRRKKGPDTLFTPPRLCKIRATPSPPVSPRRFLTSEEGFSSKILSFSPDKANPAFPSLPVNSQRTPFLRYGRSARSDRRGPFSLYLLSLATGCFPSCLSRHSSRGFSPYNLVFSGAISNGPAFPRSLGVIVEYLPPL